MSVKRRLLITAATVPTAAAAAWVVTFLAIGWQNPAMPTADAIGFANLAGVVAGWLPLMLIWWSVAERASLAADRRNEAEWIANLTAAGFTKEQALQIRELHPSSARPPRPPRRRPEPAGNDGASS